MSSKPSHPEHVHSIRWTGRVLATLCFLLLAFMFAFEGLPNIFRHGAAEALRSLALVVTLVGFVLGWFWELVGGVLVVGGMILFYIFSLLGAGGLPRSPYFLALLVPGVLFLVSWFEVRRHTKAA